MRGARTSRRVGRSREKSCAGRKYGASQPPRIQGPVGDERSQVRRGDGAAGLPGRRQLREGEFPGPPRHREPPATGRKQAQDLLAAVRPAARAPLGSPGFGGGRGAAARAGHSLSSSSRGGASHTGTEGRPASQGSLPVFPELSPCSPECGDSSPQWEGLLCRVDAPALATSTPAQARTTQPSAEVLAWFLYGSRSSLHPPLPRPRWRLFPLPERLSYIIPQTGF